MPTQFDCSLRVASYPVVQVQACLLRSVLQPRNAVMELPLLNDIHWRT